MPRTWSAPAVGGVAAGSALLALALVLFAALIETSGILESPLVVDSRLDPRYLRYPENRFFFVNLAAELEDRDPRLTK